MTKLPGGCIPCQQRQGWRPLKATPGGEARLNGMFTLKKPVVILLILLVYSVSALAGTVAVGCCSSESDHTSNDHADHQHLHTRVQAVAHAFFHWQSLSVPSVISGRQCCRLGADSGDSVPSPHAINAQQTLDRLVAKHQFGSFLVSTDLEPSSVRHGFLPLNVTLDRNPFLESILCICLLI